MAELIFGYDDGYGDNKGTNGLGDGRQVDEKSSEWERFLSVGELLIPSYATEWIPMPNKDLNENAKIDPLSYIKVEINDEAWLVGAGAMEQDPEGWIGGENKHDDYRFPVMFAGNLAILSYPVGTERVVVDCLGMGLPSETEEKPERHQKLRDLAKGTDGWIYVEVTLADGTNFKREINIKEMAIKKQPFGSLCDVILDDTGELAEDKKLVAAQFNVVADIGARTFNVYTSEMLKMIRPLTFQTNDGMYEAYFKVNDEIENLTGSKVPETALPVIIKRGFIATHDLKAKINTIYARHAANVVNELEKRFIKNWGQVVRIIWTGGGSTVLKKWLETQRTDKELMFLDRFATARGLRKAAKRQLLLKAKKEEAAKAPNKQIKATIGSATTVTE